MKYRNKQNAIRLDDQTILPKTNVYSFEMEVSAVVSDECAYTKKILRQLFSDSESAQRYKKIVREQYHKTFPNYKVIEECKFFDKKKSTVDMERIIEESETIVNDTVKKYRTRFSIRELGVFELQDEKVSQKN
jgi:poly-D-alanine transfer protein DltD